MDSTVSAELLHFVASLGIVPSYGSGAPGILAMSLPHLMHFGGSVIMTQRSIPIGMV